MPNRFQSGQYKAITPFISDRHGYYCLACFIETGKRRKPPGIRLELDHADGDKTNWSPRNLHWLCRTHNLKFRKLSSQEHVALMNKYAEQNKRERMRRGEYLSELKQEGLYEIGSPEMQVNSRAEAKWLDWMNGELNENGSISKEDGVYAGANEAYDVNPQTTERYWKKHTARTGRFREIKRNGVKYAIFREEEEKQ